MYCTHCGAKADCLQNYCSPCGAALPPAIPPIPNPPGRGALFVLREIADGARKAGALRDLGLLGTNIPAGQAVKPTGKSWVIFGIVAFLLLVVAGIALMVLARRLPDTGKDSGALQAPGYVPWRPYSRFSAAQKPQPKRDDNWAPHAPATNGPRP